MRSASLAVVTAVTTLLLGAMTSHAQTLPPPDDIPEEILRTEIITEARSPVTGEPISAAEFAALQAELQSGPANPPVSNELRRLVLLLRLRRSLQLFLP
jgi:hypothetical protein